MAMPTPDWSGLDGLRILVVEDTLLIADLIVEELREAGCHVIGPAPRVERGLTLARAEPLDGALLDINLDGEPCFPIADVLLERGVPVAFLTGYGEAAVPPEYRSMPRLSKPFHLKELIQLVRCNFTRAD
jgi:DNA-binding response OmpR family regulator